MKGHRYFSEFLARVGIERVYALSGGMIAPLLDGIGEHPALALVNCAHEQAGGFSADAEARLSGRPGVVLGTSGPGALNLATALATSYYDSVPLIAVGGQVQSYLQRGGRQVRQFALQECDFPSVAGPITKSVHSVRRARDLPQALAEAYVAAVSGRPGPVLLDIAYDAQAGDTGTADVAVPELPLRRPLSADPLEHMVAAITAAERPLILLGGGVRCGGGAEAVRHLAERSRLPVAATIAALDVLPSGHPSRIGMPGTYGTRAANLAMTACDLLLVLGSRLDHGVLGADPGAFARHRTIVRIDVDRGELSARLRSGIAVEADAGEAAEALAQALAEAGYAAPTPWLGRLAEILAAHPDTAERVPGTDVDPNGFASCLGEASRRAGTFCVDAGQHTWFAAQSLRLEAGQRFIASTGLWCMGTAIPAAIGAAFATGRPAVAIAGDASVQLNIQELAVAARERLPVKVVVLDNGAHGMVRQFQTEFLDDRHHGTLWGYAPPDLGAVFAAYGFETRSIEQATEIADALAWLWVDPFQRQALRVKVSPGVDVSPSVPFGRTLENLRPPAPPSGR